MLFNVEEYQVRDDLEELQRESRPRRCGSSRRPQIEDAVEQSGGIDDEENDLQPA